MVKEQKEGDCLRQKKQKGLTIGILVSGILDDFTKSVCKGAIQAAKQMDVNIVVLPGKYLDRDFSNSRELMYEYQYNTVFSYACKENVDAIIIAAGSIGCLTGVDNMKRMLKQYEGIPSVLIAAKMEGYVSVVFDNYKGIEEGLEYLINKLKCKRFGMIGGSTDNLDAYERRHAFEQILKQHGINITEKMYVKGDFSRRCTEAYSKLLDQNPDVEAVFCVNDETAMGFYEELRKRNLKAGRDISVFGYDDTITAAKAYPSLSSVTANTGKLGEAALKMAMRMIHGEEVKSEVIPTKFVKRDSFGRKDWKAEHEDIEQNEMKDADSLFDEIFYRYDYDEISEEIEQLRICFEKFLNSFAYLQNKENDIWENCINILALLDELLQQEVLKYADMDGLLISLEKIHKRLEKTYEDIDDKTQIKELFSIIYRKIIIAMNSLIGAMKEAEASVNYSMKLFVRGMLQFEKGNDNSYTSILDNLEWLNIKNAYAYVFETPILHLEREEFKVPKKFYLKSVLKDGQAYAVPSIKQKVNLKDIYQNRFMGDEKSVLVLLPLFSDEMLYGVVLCDLTSAIFDNGEFVINQMSLAAKMIALLQANERIQQQLEVSLATLRENNIVLDSLSKSDGLTDIFNRRGFQITAEKKLSENRKAERSSLVIYVDMNNLKIINDRYGHEEGDFALKTIAELLEATVKEGGVVGRIGGDEFACIIDYELEDSGEHVLEQIYGKFDCFNKNSDKPYNITVSAGAVVLNKIDSLTLQEALTQADEKLYEVKKYRKKDVAK